jgi:hypothetical protein
VPRPAAEVAETKLHRAKDKVRGLERQLSDARAEAGRAALACSDAGVTRTRIGEIWGTAITQVDRMLAKARSERR